MQEYNPHTSETILLTEVRSVLSQAKTAQALVGAGRGVHHGPDLGEIRMGLAFVVQLLEPWERHYPSSPGDRP